MKRNLTQILESWIAEGFRCIGQIKITPQLNGGFELRHVDDLGRDDLEFCASPHDARRLSFFDDANVYRPLKTAPTLRHGWRMVLKDAGAVRAALDHFYPAMTALWASHLQGRLRPVPLRDTLNRQTGMYAASKRLQDAEGQRLIASACASKNCLKRILWEFAPGQPLTELPSEEFLNEMRTEEGGGKQVPLLCHEACNILVAACRETVKARERASAGAASTVGHGG